MKELLNKKWVKFFFMRKYGIDERVVKVIIVYFCE